MKFRTRAKTGNSNRNALIPHWILFVILFGCLTILFKACWVWGWGLGFGSGRSQELCEERILTKTRRSLESHPGSHDCKPTFFTNSYPAIPIGFLTLYHVWKSLYLFIVDFFNPGDDRNYSVWSAMVCHRSHTSYHHLLLHTGLFRHFSLNLNSQQNKSNNGSVLNHNPHMALRAKP